MHSSSEQPLEEKQPKVSVNGALTHLEKFIAKEKQKGNRCVTSLGVALIPYQLKSKDFKTSDGRQFTKDMFDLPQLLKLLIKHKYNKHPLTRAPLYLSDINRDLFFNKKYARYLNKKLKTIGWTRRKLLVE